MPKTPQLEDAITVGGLPGTAGATETPATPGTTVDVRADASRQYVAGSRLSWLQNYPRALPWSYDDIQVSFGSDIWERMLLDSQVRAVVNVLKSAIIETGIAIAPAIEDKTTDGYAEAVDIAQRAEHMFEGMDASIDDVLWDMLDAIALGNRVAEQVYTLDTTHTGRSEYLLERLAVKPRESTAFVVDTYLTVLGLLARIPGQALPVQQGMLLADLKDITNFLPRAKFAVLTFRPHNSDPRGTSVLRPAFSHWNEKLQLRKEYLRYLTQFATPSLIGYTPEGAQSYVLTNPDGTPQTDAFGNYVQRTPEDDMVAALERFANGTTTAFPFGASVDPVNVSGDGQAFLAAFEYHDRQITKAVLSQTLATEEGQHQTRAASGTHKDILDTVTRQGKRPVCRMLERDVLAVWMTLNGYDQALRPRVSLGQAAQEDKAQLWTAAAALHRSSYLHNSQYTELDQALGLPERTPPGATSVPVAESIQVKENAGSVPPPDTGDDTAIPDEEPAG